MRREHRIIVVSPCLLSVMMILCGVAYTRITGNKDSISTILHHLNSNADDDGSAAAAAAVDDAIDDIVTNINIVHECVCMHSLSLSHTHRQTHISY